MRIRDPRTTALIFSSGKMVCTGAKRFVCMCVLTSISCVYVCICSEDFSRLAARKYARVIQKLGFPVSAMYYNVTCGVLPRMCILYVSYIVVNFQCFINQCSSFQKSSVVELSTSMLRIFKIAKISSSCP